MKVVGFDHLVIKVSDLQASLSFYGEVLGLEVLRLDEFRKGEVGFPSLRISDTSILDLMQSEDLVTGSGNVDHFCLVVDAAEMDDLVSSLVLEACRSTGTSRVAGALGETARRSRSTTPTETRSSSSPTGVRALSRDDYLWLWADLSRLRQ